MAIQNVKIHKKDGAKVEIEGEVSADAFEAHRASAIQKLGQNVEVHGFRKGKAPSDMVEKHIGDMAILEEMAERAISESYPKLLAEHNIDAIGRPEVNITKITKGAPLGFKITTATMPEVSLGNYKKAAAGVMSKEEETPEVTDDEVEKVIEQVRAQQKTHSTPSTSSGQEGSGQTTHNKQPTTNNEEADPVRTDESQGDSPSNGAGEANETNLPELTDEYVQSLGDFKDVADFRAKIKENLKLEKQTKARQKKRLEIMNTIISESTIELPEILVEEELNKLMHQFEQDVSRMGLKFEEYLKHVGKSREDMRKEWRPDAEKNAKVQLVLNKIAAQENIRPDEERVKQEVAKLVEHYKSAGNVSEDRARGYVEMILTNEAVFEFLEKQGKEE